MLSEGFERIHGLAYDYMDCATHWMYLRAVK